MDPTVQEWLNLGMRWFHVTAAIAWIGSSFFFMWLDSHLEEREGQADDVEGELWMCHSGGFYQVEKFKVNLAEMPKNLHWFKWEAYATWISGFCLLAIVYYLGARAYLIDRAVLDIDPAPAIAISTISLVLGWGMYHSLCRSPLGKMPTAFSGAALMLGALAAWAYGEVFAPRAAYIHVGALLGTLMAANVLMVIIPAQRRLVAATTNKTTPDPEYGRRAKQRSVHNNYMTLGVLFIMLSSHFPSTYGNKHAWAILVGIAVAGAVIRHYFNLKHSGVVRFRLLGVAAAMMIGLMLVARPPARVAPPAGAESAPVPFAIVERIIDTRCVNCHSETPTDDVWLIAPEGIMLDTPQQVHDLADRIYARAVLQRTMPLANQTEMTPEERDALGLWIYQGANIEQ
jgi:uncharacterized membrane protein